jgi:flagellar biogenesis protein FliO
MKTLKLSPSLFATNRFPVLPALIGCLIFFAMAICNAQPLWQNPPSVSNPAAVQKGSDPFPTTTAPTSPLPFKKDNADAASGVVQSILFAFLPVLALVLLGFWKFKHLVRGKRDLLGLEMPTTHGATSLTPKAAVHVIHWRQTAYLVGSSEAGLTILDSKPIAQENPPQAQAGGAT